MGSTDQLSPTGVVIVPGAWFAPGAWEPVAALLRARGLPVSVARLTGDSLSRDTDVVVEAITALGGAPPVVCGHSYGGAVITGLPAGRAAHLVYLAALMPTEAETVLGLAESEPTGMLDATRPAGRPGYTVLDPTAAMELLFTQSPPQQAAAYASSLIAQNMAPSHETPARVAWRETPTTYIICERDKVFSPTLQRRLAERATECQTWNSDHTPFLRAPAEVARLLAGIASRVHTGGRLTRMR